jgi:hypothetical protein
MALETIYEFGEGPEAVYEFDEELETEEQKVPRYVPPEEIAARERKQSIIETLELPKVARAIASGLERFGITTPEPGEALEPVKEFIRRPAKTALPLAGDIVLSTAGGLIPGGPALKFLGRVVGSTSGSALGSALADISNKDEINVRDLKIYAASGAIGETLSTGIGALARVAPKVASYASKKVFGIDPLTADISWIPIGGEYFRHRKNIVKKLHQEAVTKHTDNFMNEIGKSVELPTETLMNFRKVLEQGLGRKKIYSRFDSEMKKLGNNINLSGTKNLLDSMAREKGSFNGMLSDLGYNKKKGMGKMISRIYSEGQTVRRKTFENMLKAVKSEAGKADSTTRLRQDMLKQALVEDIAKQSVVARAEKEIADKAMAKASKFLRENIPLRNFLSEKQTIGQLISMDKNPQAHINRLFNTNQVDDVIALRQVAHSQPGGKEAWSNMQLSWLNDLFNKHIKENDFGERFVKPLSLARNLEDRAQFLLKTLPEEDLPLAQSLSAYASFLKLQGERMRSTTGSLATAWSALPKPFKARLGLATKLAVKGPVTYIAPEVANLPYTNSHGVNLPGAERLKNEND